MQTRSLRIALTSLPLVAAIGIWWLITTSGAVPNYVLPSIGGLYSALADAIHAGTFWADVRATASELVKGALIGALIGIGLGIVFSRVPLLDKIFMPVIVVIQVVPKIAIAPLLILWMGLDQTPKVFLVALVTAFPTLVSTMAGIDSVPAGLRDLCAVLEIRRWRRFRAIEWLHSMPIIASGLRVGVLNGVTAAVIGELLGARHGLGNMATRAQTADNAAELIIALLALSLMGLIVYLLLRYVEIALARRYSGRSADDASLRGLL